MSLAEGYVSMHGAEMTPQTLAVGIVWARKEIEG